MARSMIRKKALKPKMKSLKTRMQRLKEEMEEISQDQKCIREEQRNIGNRFGDVKIQCDQLREETELIMKQSACTQIRLSFMFDILRARKDGDIDKADTLVHFLNIVSNSKWSSNGGNGTDRHQTTRLM